MIVVLRNPYKLLTNQSIIINKKINFIYTTDGCVFDCQFLNMSNLGLRWGEMQM